jgi:beta-lactamase class A
MRLVAVLALLFALARPAAAATTSEAFAQLDGAVESFAGTAGVVVHDPANQFRYAHNEDVEFISASLYKLGVMVEAYRQAAVGRISLDDTILVGWEDINWADGWFVDPGTYLSVRSALEWTITWSDNSSALALLRTLGAENVNGAFASLGMAHTRLGYPWNVTTARDQETLFAGLLAGTVVSPAASAEMLALLERQQVNDRLPAGVPAGTVIAHKTGNLWDVAHDAGIVFAPGGPRIAIVLTAHYAAYDGVVDLAAHVAAAAYALAPPRFAATLEPGAMPNAAAAGEQVFGTVRVTNRSTFAWPGALLVARWLDSLGGVHDAPPVVIPALASGASAIVVLRAVAPSAGTYLLEARAVEARGVSGALRVVVEVR